MVDLANLPSSVDFRSEAKEMVEHIVELHKDVVLNLKRSTLLTGLLQMCITRQVFCL